MVGKNNSGALLLVLTTIVVGAFLCSSNVSADNDSVIDQINLTVPTSCSIEGTGMTSHNANIINGTYQADIGTTSLKAFCNDTNGFAIYAVGYTADTYGNTELIGANSSTSIVTGTATTTGNPDVSNWAVKLATNSGATYALTLDNGFGSYSSVPSTYTKVAHRDSGTDIGASATGSELTTTYAAYISKTQAADTYTGKVKYTLVHPANETPAQPVACPGGKICYNPNSSTVEGQMGQQSASNNASVTLYASNFKRDGYGFAGWNDKYDYSGTFYGPNQTITTPADVSTNGLSLYAVWVKSQGTIQNWNNCSSLTQDPNDGTASLSSVTALTDERDNNTYAVARLADGKCWMIENLRLADKDSNGNDMNLNSNNTHNPSLPLNNSWYYKNQQDTLTTSNHLSATTNPTIVAWCNTNSSDCIDQSMLATNNTTLFTSNITSNYSLYGNIYSYGNYYNWYSATVGYGTYGTGYGINYTAPGDICSAGWHLPTGNDATGEFGILDIALGGTGAASRPSTTPTGAIMSQRWRSYPNNFIYSGSISSSSVANRNNTGLYSSASGGGSSAYYYFTVNSISVDPGTNNSSRSSGNTVRCVSGA